MLHTRIMSLSDIQYEMLKAYLTSQTDFYSGILEAMREEEITEPVKIEEMKHIENQASAWGGMLEQLTEG